MHKRTSIDREQPRRKPDRGTPGPALVGDGRKASRRALRISLYLVVLLGLAGWTGLQATRKAWANAHLRSARRALDHQDYAHARAELNICLSYWPDDPELHFQAARALRRAALREAADADWEARALEHLRECERLNYPPEDIALEMTLIRVMRGDLEQVEPHLLALLTQDNPDSSVILETLVPVYLARFQVPRALLCVSRLMAEEPDNAYAYYWRGAVRDLLLSNGQAIDDYRRVLELKPDFADARRRLAEDLLVIRRYEEARDHFERLIASTPGNPDLLLGLARAAHGLGNLEAAKTLLDRLLATQPAHSLALEERGKLAFELGRLDEAEQFLREALQRVPRLGEANYTLYQCLTQRGQKEEAAKYRNQFEKVEADTRRFRKVTELIRGQPQNADLRAEAGTLLLRNDQTEQALGWLTSALQMEPYHPAAHQALAEYYTKLGQQQQADRHRQLARQGRSRLLQGMSIPVF
jgi:tetratricopeptide (TPR) repeat protein